MTGPAMPPVRVLIVDDDDEYRGSLACLLTARVEVEVAAAYSSGTAAIDHLENESVPVVILDYSLPGADGAETARAIRQRFPATRVVMLTGFAFPESLDRSLLVGVAGFLTKDQSIEELVQAVCAASGEHVVLSPRATQRLVDLRVREDRRREDAAWFYDVLATLPRKYVRVVDGVVEGLGNQRIARSLGLSETTVRTYTSKALEYFSCRSRTELAVLAARAGYDPGDHDTI